MLRCKVQRSMRGRTEGPFSSSQKGLRRFVVLEVGGRVFRKSDPPQTPGQAGEERHQIRQNTVGWVEHRRIPTQLLRECWGCTPTYACCLQCRRGAIAFAPPPAGRGRLGGDGF
jgi:hypothetical protein